MPTSNTNYPIQITILDKLLSETSFSELTYSQPSSAIKKFYQSIKQDLENLLNTRKYFIPHLYDFVGLEESILNYGIYNFWSMTFDIDAGREKLRSTIEQAIKLFEPRLKEAQVFLSETNESIDNNISFRIEAYSNIGHADDRVIFSSVFEPQSKRFLVISDNE